MDLTEAFAQRVTCTAISEIPEQALHEAERAFMDVIGVSIAAVNEPVTRNIVDYAIRIGGAPHSTIIGHHHHTSQPMAALVNGCMGHVLDLDDTTSPLCGHPSSVLVPTILSLGENLGASGIDALAAYVLGFDVASHLARLLNPAHYNIGWHTTGTLLGIGAAAAAARLLKLSTEQAKMALGIAASLVSGLRQNFGSMTKALHAGRAAENGVVSALLAASGWTADLNALEGPVGFLQLFDGRAEPPQEWPLPSPHDWEILRAGIGFKRFPSCGMTHAGIEAMLELRNRYKLQPERVVEVEAVVTSPVPSVLMHPNPSTGLEGKFSLNYCIALALSEGEVTQSHFTVQGFTAAKVARDIMQRVNMVVDPKLKVPEDFPACCPTIVAVRLDDGRLIEKRIDHPLGQPGNPIPDRLLQEKFVMCAAPIYGQERTNQIMEELIEMRFISDVKVLTDLVAWPHT
jgi:2-methylcitrate dehydratase PrpD